MAAQPPFINVRKYTVVCGCGGCEWWVEKERIMGLSPLGKEGQKSVFIMAFLGFKRGLGEESMEKFGTLNNEYLSARKQAMGPKLRVLFFLSI